MDSRLERTNQELANFLRRSRERLLPQALGLPENNRRRTPGLRREEVAALAGVGLTWYTWLEQGRTITVSSAILGRIADVLQLDPTQQQHLFLLAQKIQLPKSAQNNYILPDFLRHLLDDLIPRPAHVLNLCWDVIGWNEASNKLYGFSSRPENTCNLLYMLFTDPDLQTRIIDWSSHAPSIVASFRRDFTQVLDRDHVEIMVEKLIIESPYFAKLWRAHEVHNCGRGMRRFSIEGDTPTIFEHNTFILDEDPSLRLIIYQPISTNANIQPNNR